jgi:hypothetical protein
MKAPGGFPPSILRRPPGRLGLYAPWPLVGVTALLVALIVFTPVLVSNSHTPAPGFLTQAEIVVDRSSGNDTFQFYVWALGEEIRYSQIDVAIASDFNWTGANGVPWSTLNWTEWHNESNVLAEIVGSTANPVALDIFANYVYSTGNTWYVGELAFFVTGPAGSESLYWATSTSGLPVTSPLSVASYLPLTIPLVDAGSGGGP